jgi:hypothetical protein
LKKLVWFAEFKALFRKHFSGFLNMTTHTTDNRSSKYNEGCEWCGTRIPAIKAKGKNGLRTHGLESAHIIARDYAPEHDWNTFILCPTCHKIFDEVIKPRIQSALETAVSGYPDNPNGKAKEYISATDYKDAVEKLVKPQNLPATKLALAAQKKKLWTERPPQKQPSKQAHKTAAVVPIPPARTASTV